jgi:hypothetical protein
MIAIPFNVILSESEGPAYSDLLTKSGFFGGVYPEPDEGSQNDILAHLLLVAMLARNPNFYYASQKASSYRRRPVSSP